MTGRASARLAMTVATFGLSGQAAPPADGVAAAYKALSAGRYLAARDTFAKAAFGPDGKVRDEGAFQSWAQYSPMMTDELPTDTFMRRPDPSPPAAGWAKQVRHATAHDAIAEIVRRARSTNIVILNEAHYSPRDRAFALRVARALRPLGYSILAAETFTDAARLAADGFARINSGAYLKDPVFAGFLREALAMGYRPVAYEITMEQMAKAGDRSDRAMAIATREDAQVANLMSAVFTATPGAKVLIHVGHSHVAEAPLRLEGEKIEWMAARLKRATGIDPLTVDQTSLTDLSTEAQAAYPLAAAKVGRTDGILFDGDRPLVLGDYAGAVDLQVVHPARTYRYGRPTWLTALGGHPVAIPKALLPTRGERLIQAFASDAPADAVPLDQVLVTAGRPVPYLMLPTTKVRFATQP